METLVAHPSGIEAAWRLIAEQYRCLGEDEMARAVALDLESFRIHNSDSAAFEERYYFHVRQWERFKESIARDEGYSRD